MPDPRPSAVLSRTEVATLAVATVAVWVGTYALLNLDWFSLATEYPAERAFRRLFTCSAGAALCIVMIPALERSRAWSAPARLGAAAAVSLAAYLVHLLVRIATFNLIDPLWGPVSPGVVADALRGSGWMFPLCATIYLFVLSPPRAPPERGPQAPSADCGGGIWCVQGRRRIRIAFEDILLSSGEGDYVAVHTPTGRYLARGPLKALARVLPQDRFLRVHRSAIVRLDAVVSLERAGSAWRARLRGDLDAPVSRGMGSALRERLGGGRSNAGPTRQREQTRNST